MLTLTTQEEVKSYITNNELVIAYFSTSHCSVCVSVKPKIEALAAKYPSIKLFYIGIDEIPELSGEYSVFAVPTIIIFISGKEYKRFSRFFAITELQETIERYLELSK